MDNPEPMNQQHTLASPTTKQRWLKVFERMFRNGNYTVDTFDDPLFFLETILKHPQQYAGIICDIKMPQMDGYQVFETIKKNPATQNIPFVIISGVLTQDNNLSRIQGVPYISKLDDDLRSKIFQELIEVIENWPRVRDYLHSQNISDDKIDFFCQFFINYHKYFNEILSFINKMRQRRSSCHQPHRQGMHRLHKRTSENLHAAYCAHAGWAGNNHIYKQTMPTRTHQHQYDPDVSTVAG